MPKFKKGDRIIEVRRRIIYDLVSYDEKDDSWFVRIVDKGNDSSPFENRSTRSFAAAIIEEDQLYFSYVAALQFDKDLEDLLED